MIPGSGESPADPVTATTVRLPEPDERTVADGPFAEAEAGDAPGTPHVT